MVQKFIDSTENRGDQVAMPRPTAPPLVQVHQEGEDFSNLENYVDFKVLGNRENYIVRAEKKAIADSNNQLAQLIKGAGPYEVGGVDKDNFEIFIRYLETKFIKFHSASHMLQMLQLASRFQCRQLEIHCVKELDLNLTIDNVLEVFRALWYYNSITPVRAAPPEPKKKKRRAGRRRKSDQPEAPITPEEYFAALLKNCLQLIDMHTEDVFAQKAMLALRFEELEVIAKRDTLQMSSETVLLDLLANWSRVECQRKNLELTAENRRRVLGALCYAPRYLAMTRKEFDGAKDRIELLDPVEYQLVEDILNGRKVTNLTPEQETMVANFKAQRPPFAPMPIHLSTRSCPKNYPRKMRKAAEEADGEKPNCCERLILTCVSIFACIFD